LENPHAQFKEDAMSSVAASLPPGPRSKFPYGNELAWRNNPPEFLRQAAEQYGPLCAFPLKGREIFLVSDPEGVREVLVTKEKAFIKGAGFQKLKPWLGEGVVTSEGAKHQRQRRMLQPAFHRKRIEAYAEIMTQCAEEANARLHEGEQIDLLAFLERTAFAISTRCMFDTNLDAGMDGFFEAMKQSVRYMDVMNAYSPQALLERVTGRAEKQKLEAIRVLHGMVDQIIASRRADTQDRGDLLSMLVSTLDEEGDGKGLTDEELRDEVMTLLVAGFDTVASSLTSCFFLLARNPAAEKAVLDEMDAVLQGRPITLAEVPRLTQAGAAFSETLRLHPPAWVLPRSPKEEVTIGTQAIPAGATVLVSSYVNHRNPAFFPNPDEFDLGRWSPEKKGSLPKFAYFPFGSGSRVCIGEQFAWMEAILIMAAFLPRWHFEPAFAGPMKYQATMSLRPKDGCPVHVRAR